MPVRLLLAGALLLGACSRSEGVWLDPRAAPEISALEVGRGTPFRLSAHRGKVVLLSFGYTSCVDFCPLTLDTFEQVARRFERESPSVAAVYVTVDPERDSPERFRQFLEPYAGRVEGVFLERNRLQPVLDGYEIVTKKLPPPVRHYVAGKIDPSTQYAIEHTAAIYVIDPEGRLRIRYPYKAAASAIEEGVDRLIDEEG